MATLRVNESRPAELSQQPEASLAWWRVTSTAKRSVQPVVRRPVAVLARGLVKENKVPDEEIERARAAYEEVRGSPGATHVCGGMIWFARKDDRQLTR